jgi:hypothetical protein
MLNPVCLFPAFCATLKWVEGTTTVACGCAALRLNQQEHSGESLCTCLLYDTLSSAYGIPCSCFGAAPGEASGLPCVPPYCCCCCPGNTGLLLSYCAGDSNPAIAANMSELARF